MADLPKKAPSASEAIRPAGDLGKRIYVVEVTEVGERVVHDQDWASFEDPDSGKRFGAYHTIAKREKVSRVLFRGEFTERPKISALATLMETPE